MSNAKNAKGNVKANGDTPLNCDAAVDATVDDLSALRRDLAALMSQLKSGAIVNPNDATEKAVVQLADRARHLYDSVAAKKERSIKAISRQVEEQPVMSLLIAFGVGYVASRLLNR